MSVARLPPSLLRRPGSRTLGRPTLPATTTAATTRGGPHPQNESSATLKRCFPKALATSPASASLWSFPLYAGKVWLCKETEPAAGQLILLVEGCGKSRTQSLVYR